MDLPHPLGDGILAGGILEGEVGEIVNVADSAPFTHEATIDGLPFAEIENQLAGKINLPCLDSLAEGQSGRLPHDRRFLRLEPLHLPRFEGLEEGLFHTANNSVGGSSPSPCSFSPKATS